jgi:pimeloyl-ACP methyl ester carboxylesterase
MCSISGVAPLNLRNFRYLNPQQKKTFVLHSCLPMAVQKVFLDRVWKNGLDKLDQFLFTNSDEVEGPDQKVFKHPDFSPILNDTLKIALSQGPDGILQDIRVYTKQWGFNADEISCPVTLWHGAADDIVNVAYAHEMKSILKNADLKVVDNEGHYSLSMNFRDQILADLL